MASFYGDSISRVRDGLPSVKHIFPPVSCTCYFLHVVPYLIHSQGWLAHLETKQLHFEAAAQLRKSVDELEAGRLIIKPLHLCIRAQHFTRSDMARKLHD